MIFDQRNNPRDCAVVNYLADYDGFSLYDMVSYDRKHNEANGEYNRDGTDHNYSWNCGFEGECRKKSVLELRKKQIKMRLPFYFFPRGYHICSVEMNLAIPDMEITMLTVRTMIPAI